MARLKETPAPVLGRGEKISATSHLSRERLSSSSSGSGDSDSDSDSHSDTEDSDSSDGSSSEDISGTDAEQRDTATALPKTRPAYEPPHGFQPLSTDPSSSRASQLLDPANLAGKQIWHITVPASVPVDALKEVSVERVMNGEAVFSHGGSDYGFVTVNEPAAGPSQTILLVPGKKGYRPAAVGFAQTLHLRQVVKLPTLINTVASTEAASQASSALAPARRTAREQPKGLKMRFMPIGVSGSRSPGLGWSSSEDDSDTGEAGRTNVVGNGTKSNDFRFPIDRQPERRKRKHEKLDDGIGEITVGTERSPRKKKSKRNREHTHRSAGDIQAEPATSPPLEDHTSRSRAEELHKSHTKPSAPSAAIENSPSGRPETSQERSRRKEKERRRRERSEKTHHDQLRHSLPKN
ncbi:hypothetical protein GP486_000237 [Trichoglossum hirsutum]|uniref:Uncharacterized protein n=1 Tax=Trichoglossum hirsutum TaxID=265104 RepID=A0A9P8LJE9_9PEZI|nr:hypothetical protein GP486_000237 [Trichoglossum hirsutum]